MDHDFSRPFMLLLLIQMFFQPFLWRWSCDPVWANNMSWKVWETLRNFSPPWLKGSSFQLLFFLFFFPPLFLTLVNGIWIYGNDLAHVRWKVQRWTPTMLKKSEQKNGRNLSPRWCSWATESLPVTIFLWAFWANKPWLLVALLVKDPVTFS